MAVLSPLAPGQASLGQNAGSLIKKTAALGGTAVRSAGICKGPKRIEWAPVSSGKGFGNNGKQAKKSGKRQELEVLGMGEDIGEQDEHHIGGIVRLLPRKAQQELVKHELLSQLIEVVMDLGRAPLARFPNSGDYALSDTLITKKDLERVVEKVGDFGGDNRAGIEGTLHRISCIRNRNGEVVGMTCRVGRDIGNSADFIADLVLSGKSILLMGQPGVGKTTAIRGISRMLADTCEKRVVIVDTSNEIGGDGDVPHSGIGRSRRMQVSHPEDQCQVMIEAVENHMPEVIVIDEIGTEMECQAARTISQRGVQLVATAHGCQLENVMKNPALQDLVGGITSVTLGDDEARRRRVQKSVLERERPPVFDIAIEIIDRDTWRIHHDLAEAVDAVLAGSVGQGEIRNRNPDSDPLSKAGGRPLPPTLPVLPDINLGTISEAAQKAVYKMNEIAIEPASSAVPLRQSTQAQPTSPSDSSSAVSRENQAQGDGEKDDLAAQISVGHLDPDSDGEAMARSWFALGGLREGEHVVLTLFTAGIDVKLLWEVVVAMELQEKLAVTPYLKDADAILGTRMNLKMSGWIRQASRKSGIPLFPIKSCSASQLVRALHSLLGLHPSNSVDEQEEVAPSTPEDSWETEENVPAATSLSHNESEALSEVQYAIEEIVLPRVQPIELLPRLPTVIKMQVKEVKSYGLECEVVGTGNTMHLRILPVLSDNEAGSKVQGALA